MPASFSVLLAGLFTAASFYTFAILLADGLLDVAQGRPLTGRWRPGPLADAP